MNGRVNQPCAMKSDRERIKFYVKSGLHDSCVILERTQCRFRSHAGRKKQAGWCIAGNAASEDTTFRRLPAAILSRASLRKHNLYSLHGELPTDGCSSRPPRVCKFNRRPPSSYGDGGESARVTVQSPPSASDLSRLCSSLDEASNIDQRNKSKGQQHAVL